VAPREADVTELLAGWGRTAPSAPAEVLRPASVDELAKAAATPGAASRGAIARGLGRSYGDAAQNAGGVVVDTTAASGILAFDREAGVVRVAAGTSLEDVLRTVVPAGWFVPVTPGTRFVTVGGAIAADIHGKDHHAVGTFCAHLRSLVLAGADGSTRTLTPEGTPAAFWATCGGMGLTGTIVEATFSLRPIASSRLLVDTDRLDDLDDLLVALREGQSRHRYSVAWVDVLARGRSVLTQGDFATDADGELGFDPGPAVPSPPAPSGLLNPLTVRVANEVWFRRAPRRRRDEVQTITRFFHPLDLAQGWNRVYGSRGFLQWQCLVPFGAEDVLRRCVEALGRIRAASFVTVLKTFGAADPGPLSFPAPGWTLAVDIPAGSTAMSELLDRLDRDVVDAGGRLYLAKDSRCRPDLVPAMYPRLDEWRAVRDELDPDRRFTSDLARRLRLLA
jgi:decaprenylphospho-beta-D-ribofuranose 2-oxidase